MLASVVVASSAMEGRRASAGARTLAVVRRHGRRAALAARATATASLAQVAAILEQHDAVHIYVKRNLV